MTQPEASPKTWHDYTHEQQAWIWCWGEYEEDHMGISMASGFKPFDPELKSFRYNYEPTGVGMLAAYLAAEKLNLELGRKLYEVSHKSAPNGRDILVKPQRSDGSINMDGFMREWQLGHADARHILTSKWPGLRPAEIPAGDAILYIEDYMREPMERRGFKELVESQLLPTLEDHSLIPPELRDRLIGFLATSEKVSQ